MPEQISAQLDRISQRLNAAREAETKLIGDDLLAALDSPAFQQLQKYIATLERSWRATVALLLRAQAEQTAREHRSGKTCRRGGEARKSRCAPPLGRVAPGTAHAVRIRGQENRCDTSAAPVSPGPITPAPLRLSGLPESRSHSPVRCCCAERTRTPAFPGRSEPAPGRSFSRPAPSRNPGRCRNLSSNSL